MSSTNSALCTIFGVLAAIFVYLIGIALRNGDYAVAAIASIGAVVFALASAGYFVAELSEDTA